MDLKIQSKEQNGVQVVALEGRIVFGPECNAVRAAVKTVLETDMPRVVLDLKGVRSADSGGIGTLVGLYTSARSAGGDLKLVAPSEKVLHVLEITRLLPVLGAHPDVSAAIAAMGQKASA